MATKINDVAKKAKPLSEKAKVEIDLQKLRDKREGKDAQIAALREKIVGLETELGSLKDFSQLTPQASKILAKEAHDQSESAAVVVWSDHHNEERVDPGQVSGKNEFNLQIYDRRFSQLVHGTLSWLGIEQQKTSIRTLVIALLGDFFTNSIHEDLAEANFLAPMDAAYNAQSHLIGGIEYILSHTPKTLELLIVCHSGNHARTTKKQRIATEAGNSLEHFMYYVMRDHFKGNPRVKFQIAEGYHSYVTFFEKYVVRFHHGHAIKYQGGVGGISISANKAIAQWNKARPDVNLDVFGHFHTRYDGGSFISNGCLIGYSAYAVSIKGSYEKPSQTFFLINKQYLEKTLTSQIYLS
jgi:hypothetical protein